MYISVISQVYLRRILGKSQAYLRYISGKYLRHISSHIFVIFQNILRLTTANNRYYISQADLRQIFGIISTKSQMYLMHI